MRVLRVLRRYPSVDAVLVVLCVVLVLTLVGQHEVARWVATACVGLVVAWLLIGMIREALHRHFGLDVLAVIAIVATVAVGEFIASLIVVLMVETGAALEDIASRRAKNELTSLLDRSPRVAHLVARDDDSAHEGVRDVPVGDIEVGDVIVVRSSEIVPVDGVLVTDAASFDESSLTGESLPVHKTAGDSVMSGAINGTRTVHLRAERRAEDSQYQQIVALVSAAAESRAPVVRLADRFALPFTAVSLALAALAWALSSDPARFAQVLVLATPCPLLIAAPVAFLAGLSRAAKTGVIMKGGAVIEQLAGIRSAAFDKTGTLTQGRPRVREVRSAGGFVSDEVLQLAASAEQYSSHVFAEGIRRSALSRGLRLSAAEDASEAATNGVTALIEGRAVSVGKLAYIQSIAADAERQELAPGDAAAYVAVGGRFAGALVLADEPRGESAAVVSWLRAHGVAPVIMLTGDDGSTAGSIGSRVGVDDVRAGLLPPQKVALASQLRPRPMMMVGDGINDAPVLAAADVGVALGARGATAAGDAADVVILVDSLAKVVDAVEIARQTVRIALTAIWIGISLSIALMLIAMTGIIPAVVGALTQELVDVATIVYALRALGGAKLAPSLPGGHCARMADYHDFDDCPDGEHGEDGGTRDR